MRHIFAFGSPSFRRLNRAAEAITESELTELALAEPRLLRRPLLVTDEGRVIAGARAVAQAVAGGL